MSRRANNPAGLGIVPVIALTGGLIAAGASYIAGKWGIDQIGKDTPGPAPAPAPAAPRTKDDFLNWSPERLQSADAAALDHWRKTAADAGAAYFTPPEDNGMLYVVLFVTAAAVLISFKD